MLKGWGICMYFCKPGSIYEQNCSHKYVYKDFTLLKGEGMMISLYGSLWEVWMFILIYSKYNLLHE